MDRLPHDTTLAGPDDPPEPRLEHDPDEARDQLLDDIADGLRDPPPYLRPRFKPHLLADRAAYEAKHGTLDGPPETHRWDADPF